MGMTKQKHRKKIILINREFQFRYTRAAVAVGIISTILTSVLILFPLYTFEILRIPKFLPIPILGAMVFAALVNVIFVAFMGVVLTHKIAGPMYALVRHIRQVGMGQWKSFMSVREDDELKFVVRNFNDMLEELSRINEQDLDLVNQVSDKIESLPAENKEELMPILDSLKQRLESRQRKAV